MAAAGAGSSGPVLRRYPPAADRPERPLPEAWAAAAPASLVLEADGFPVGSATALDGGRQVTTLSALQQSQRGFGGGLALGAPLATDLQTGLVLLSGAGSVGLPLAPAAPTAGDQLAAGPGFPTPVHQPCVVAERLPGGLFLFRGLTLPSSAGAPLVNGRGELVGIVLGKPSGFPGNDYGLAADTSVVLALLESAGRPPRAQAGDPLGRVAEGLLLRDVPEVDWETPTRSQARVVPGVALGNYRLGVRRDALVKALGPGESRGTGRIAETLAYPVYRLEFTLLAGRVVAISTTNAFYATSTGVGVGTRWAEARRGPEFAGALTGTAPGGRAVVVGAGLELEVGPRGEVQRLLVTPR